MRRLIISYCSSLLLLALLVVLVSVSDGALPRPASVDTPWAELRAALSDPKILQVLTPQIFNDNCIQPFVFDPSETDGLTPLVSNYQLMDHPACLGFPFCGYQNCSFDDSLFPLFPVEQSTYVLFENHTIDEDRLNLPEMTLEPQGVSDVVAAIQFCAKYKVGVSVKVAGHSYFGASSAKGTLLIKLSTKYPKYGIGGSIYECKTEEETDTSSANAMACLVAQSRNKSAVIRIGGGEIFDEAYRAVSFDWNSAHPDRKYHLVGGGAGTVSAAGGWMQSGGLSGTTGMRLFGVGVDQVLHMEVVLPSGLHVRFGPTSWEEKPGYPRVTKVSGYCNAVPSNDETEWVWAQCQEDIDFADLWFAFRGGGGGTYGVLTSLHYQLHHYPGELTIVSADATQLLSPENGLNETSIYILGRQYVEFIHQFLFTPSVIGVSEADSRGCNSAQTAGLVPSGFFFCYGTSGRAMVTKWQEKVTNEQEIYSFLGLPEAAITAIYSLLIEAGTVESYAHLVASDGSDPSVPIGRLGDNPKPSLIPELAGFPNYADALHTHFPLAVFESEDLFPLAIDALTLEVFTKSGPHSLYLMGGAIPESDDGMNALSPTRRNAAYLKPVTDASSRKDYFDLFYGSLDRNGDFPGSSDHNHANVFEMGPLKSDWGTPCPSDLPQYERDKLCISQQEAAWGTANLRRLEAIKRMVDPNELFICTSGVGYSSAHIDSIPEEPVERCIRQRDSA